VIYTSHERYCVYNAFGWYVKTGRLVSRRLEDNIRQRQSSYRPFSSSQPSRLSSTAILILRVVGVARRPEGHCGRRPKTRTAPRDQSQRHRQRSCRHPDVCEQHAMSGIRFRARPNTALGMESKPWMFSVSSCKASYASAPAFFQHSKTELHVSKAVAIARWSLSAAMWSSTTPETCMKASQVWREDDQMI